MFDNKFYVYIYLDPRKPGKFNYKWFSFEFEPFYVGKGSGNRKLAHLNESEDQGKNLFKIRKIQKIKRIDLTPIILTIKENLSNASSGRLETLMIKTIGRLDLHLGPLTNLTDGGEGNKHWIMKEETKQRISLANFGKRAWNKGKTKETDERIKMYSEKNFGYVHTEDCRKQMSESAKIRADRENRSELFKINNPSSNPEIRKRIVEIKIKNGSMAKERNGRWVKMDEEELKHLFFQSPTLTRRQISLKMNVSFYVICSRIKKLGLKRKRPVSQKSVELCKIRIKNKNPNWKILDESKVIELFNLGLGSWKIASVMNEDRRSIKRRIEYLKQIGKL